MSKSPAKHSERIRWPTAVVILVLATIGYIVLWQVVLEGSLSRPTPEKVVREFLRLGVPHPDSLEIDDISVLYELPKQEDHAKSAVLRVRFHAQDELGQLKSFDKIVVVVGEQVKAAEDWSPELEAKVHLRFDKSARK